MSNDTRLVIVDQTGRRLAVEVPPADPAVPGPDPRPLVPFTPPGPPPPDPGAPPRLRAPAGQPGIDLGFVTRVVRRYWLLIAVLGAAVGAGAAAAVWEFLPPGRQSACAVLHISDQQPVVLQATPEGQINAVVYRQRQQQAVTSMKVLETAFANPAVAGLPVARDPNRVGELERRVKVDFKLGQEFMRITVEADTPDESLALVTAVKDAYLSEVVNKERSIWERSVAQREAALKELEATFARNRAELAKKLDPFKLKLADAPFLPQLRHSAEEKLRQKESDLRQVQARMRTLEIEDKADAARAGEKVTAPAAAVDEELDRDPELASLHAKTAAAEKELADKAGAAGADSTLPGIVRLRREAEAARHAEAEYRKTARPRVEERLAEREREKRRGEARDRKRELERYRDWQTALLGDIEEARANAIRLSGAGAEVAAIGETVARQEKQIADDRDAIARQRREVETAPSRVSEHEPPRVVPLDEFRRRVKYSGMAGVGGLAVVLVGFVGLEQLRNRVSDPSQVVGLTLPVLGTLPNLDPSGRAASAHGPDRAIAVEAIDTVRTMLLHSLGPNGPRVAMISSAAPGEGKTTLSGCLAESLARAGFRTLLVDGDLRRPTAHARYHTPVGPGVAEILRGEASVLACCHGVDGLGLWVLPPGRASAAASELLPKGGWGWLVQEARELFDFVVVDTAPLLAVVDPLLMAPACDGVVLAVMRDVSRVNLLADAANRLRALEIPILGCVVHRAYRPPTGGYYYYANRPPTARRYTSGPDPAAARAPDPPPAAG
jgi:capsular exopolysaccharide synthesis family protein